MSDLRPPKRNTKLVVNVDLPDHVDVEEWEKSTLPILARQIKYATEQFALKGGAKFDVRHLTVHGEVKI